MNIRPYQLSQLTVGECTLAGYSVAGEETVILAPELDCCFDIGKCPREALTINHVLLSHGHADHVAGIPYYFAQRDFQGIAGGKALAPRSLVKPLEGLMRAWGRVEGHVPPYEFIGMDDGDDYAIRRDLLVRAFNVRHRHACGALGYSVIEVRKKLKEEFLGLDGPRIVELKTKGVEIENRIEVPLVAYLGDTAKADYASMPHVAEAKALLIECTFFDEEHRGRAKHGRHVHVEDLPDMLEGMHNERIILIHLTRRTNLAMARKILRKRLRKDILDRVTFLMSRRYIEED